MKSLIIYESVHHSNTERVARAIADALGADLLRADRVDPAALARYDLVGLGSGIYFGRHHRRIRALAARLPATTKHVFVFSTSGMARNQNGRLVAALRRRGLSVVGDFFCPGFDTMGPFFLIGGLKKGRPDARDLESARRFACELVSRLGSDAAAAS